MIRIMLVEDHTSFLDALAFMVNREPNLCVVARATSLAEARTALRHLESVDVAVIDLTLPDGHGVDLIGDLDTHTTALILCRPSCLPYAMAPSRFIDGFSMPGTTVVCGRSKRT